MRIQRILCPNDLAPGSEAALRYGVALARAYDAALLQIYCQDGAAEPFSTVKASEAMNAALLKSASPSESRALGAQSNIINCEDPGECITREAARCRADLIIMRSRRRPHRAALLGSVAESVSRTAPCPVMVLHDDERGWVNVGEREIALKRVLG